jgi:hypothetical protein
MQIIVCSCSAAGREASDCPGQADSGASRESHDPDALAAAGAASRALAIAAKAIVRIVPIPCRIDDGDRPGKVLGRSGRMYD